LPGAEGAYVREDVTNECMHGSRTEPVAAEPGSFEVIHRLRPADVVRLGGTGLRTRPLRVFLSALGIAIGVAAMVAVVGISGSGQAEVDRRLDALGTNLLRVAPGESLAGEKAKLPFEAVAMVRRIPPVEQVTATGAVDASVYRNERIAIGRTNSLTVLASDTDLLPAVGGKVERGRWLDSATGSRLSIYGWAYYFGTDAELDLAVASNVCVRCGAGHSADWLLVESKVRRFGLWRYYRCAGCSTVNLFL
jgi:hypothetical protein